MKALTIIQPWASLIAAGIKRVENRRWTTDYRGPLLIHAGANRTMYAPDPRVLDAPYSMIVARCELVDVVGITKVPKKYRAIGASAMAHVMKVPGQEEFIEGPYCWILANIQPLAIPFTKGQLGLFEIDLEAAIANGKSVAAMLEAKHAPKPTRAERKAQKAAADLVEWNRKHGVKA